MPKLSLSKIKSPPGALGEIERVTVTSTNQLPVSKWLDVSLVDKFLQYHPVSVRKVSRHYELVSGFRAFHAACSLLGSDDTIQVRITKSTEVDLVTGALFELITHSLLHNPESCEAKQRVYRQLKELSRTLRKDHDIKVPATLSANTLKSLLGLEGVRITYPRKRKSELDRIMGSR